MSRAETEPREIAFRFRWGSKSGNTAESNKENGNPRRRRRALIEPISAPLFHPVLYGGARMTVWDASIAPFIRLSRCVPCLGQPGQ
jgi:hypothetical protein